MRVHVDERGREVHVDDSDGVATRLQHRAVGLRDCPSERAVLDGPPVDQRVKSHGAGTSSLGRSQVTFDPERAALARALLEARLAQYLKSALLARSDAEVLARHL